MGFRPDNVAEDLYGSASLDWVIITCAGIVNIRDECLLDSNELYNYSLNKYGEKLNEVRYYETKEIRDLEGHLILPAGKKVNSNFTVKYFDKTFGIHDKIRNKCKDMEYQIMNMRQD